VWKWAKPHFHLTCWSPAVEGISEKCLVVIGFATHQTGVQEGTSLQMVLSHLVSQISITDVSVMMILFVGVNQCVWEEQWQWEKTQEKNSWSSGRNKIACTIPLHMWQSWHCHFVRFAHDTSSSSQLSCIFVFGVPSLVRSKRIRKIWCSAFSSFLAPFPMFPPPSESVKRNTRFEEKWRKRKN